MHSRPGPGALRRTSPRSPTPHPAQEPHITLRPGAMDPHITLRPGWALTSEEAYSLGPARVSHTGTTGIPTGVEVWGWWRQVS